VEIVQAWHRANLLVSFVLSETDKTLGVTFVVSLL
jgi:hypothetical protein